MDQNLITTGSWLHYYNNNKHSTSLRYPIRITVIDQTVISITKPKKKRKHGNKRIVSGIRTHFRKRKKEQKDT